jgi:hypothetical protein
MGNSLNVEQSKNSVNTFLPENTTSFERARAAIVGAFIADAATMPLHWIYDQIAVENMLKERIKSTQDLGPEFFDPPSSPLYNYDVGCFSPYGDENLVFLKSIAERGFFDNEAICSDLLNFYLEYTGRLNRLSRRFLEIKEKGNSWEECRQDADIQFWAAPKICIIVARYAGNPSMLSKIEMAVRIHQSSERVIVSAKISARLLEKVILGMKIQEAFRWAMSADDVTDEEREYISSVEAVGLKQNLPFSAASEMFGLSGHLPDCLLASLYGLRWSFKSYVAAVRANIVAAGDNVCRAWLIGNLNAACDVRILKFILLH